MYDIGINKCEKSESSLQRKIREVAKAIDIDVQKHLQVRNLLGYILVR